jgi:lysozyme
MALYGVDISNYQRNVDYNAYAFYIMKASEGRTYKDPILDRHFNAVKAAGKLYGFYHYARPENNSMRSEVDHFLSLVGHHIGRAIFALDWEGNALRYGPDKALEFLDYFYARTGVRCLFYCSDSQTRRYAKIAQKNYGLWDAKYSSRGPAHIGWPNIALWQYQGSPIDKNVFYGDATTWMKYAAKDGQKIVVPETVAHATANVKRDQWVKDIQNQLNLQYKAGLAVDGIPGPKTLGWCPLLRVGARGEITKLVQQRVGAGADGIFGNNTKTAVKNFQRAHGLSADGVVGRQTWKKLLWLKF